MKVGLKLKVCVLPVMIGMFSAYQAGCAGTIGEGTQTSTAPANAVTMPLAPSNVAATAGNAQVGLTWNPSVGATSYHVKRSMTSGGTYTQIGVPSATGYVDSTVSNKTSYFYAISAVNSAGESSNSAQVSAKPEAPASSAVTSVTVSPGTASSVRCGPDQIKQRFGQGDRCRVRSSSDSSSPTDYL
jgi:hypothetical protein